MRRVEVRLSLITALSVASLLSSARISVAEELVREISWSRLKSEGKLLSGKVLEPRGAARQEQLVVESTSNAGATVTVLTLDSPGITESRYAIRGQVRHEKVEGQGYLEMWNVFADGSQYFSRTVSQTGPMKSLSGTSDWRPFVLPFFINESADKPVELILNVVLPGRGSVALSPLNLLQYGSTEDPLAQLQEGQWWSDQAAGLIGGIAGSLIGCLGGLIGWLGSGGRARGFVLGTLKTLIFVGAAALVLAGVAVAGSQPYAVYYPLFLLGLICVIVPVLALGRLRKQYEAAELRRMKALDTA